MITKKIVLCKKDHKYQNHQYLKDEKYILQIDADENWTYTIIKILDFNERHVSTMFENSKYYIDRNLYFTTEKQLRKEKLNKLKKYE